MTKLTFVHGDDWVAVYRYGLSQYQGHSVHRHFYYGLLREAGFEVEEVDLVNEFPVVDKWSTIFGTFPQGWPPTPTQLDEMQTFVDDASVDWWK